jgi:hypothetical protein
VIEKQEPDIRGTAARSAHTKRFIPQHPNILGCACYLGAAMPLLRFTQGVESQITPRQRARILLPTFPRPVIFTTVVMKLLSLASAAF